MTSEFEKMRQEFSNELAERTKAFEGTKAEFSKIEEYMEHEGLDRYRAEIVAAFSNFSSSHQNEKQKITKCQKQVQRIIDDKITIASLQKEIERTQFTVEEARKKEAGARETKSQIEIEIQELRRKLEQGAGTGTGQETLLNDLAKQKEDYTKEREAQLILITAIRNEMHETSEKIKKVESEKMAVESDISDLKLRIAERQAEFELEQKRKDRLEKEMREYREIMEQRQKEILGKKQSIEQAKEQVAKLDGQVREQRGKTEKATKDFERLCADALQAEHSRDDWVKKNSLLSAENTIKEEEIKAKEDEVSSLRAEQQKMNKVKDGLLKKIKQLEEQRDEFENGKNALRAEFMTIQRENEMLARQQEADKKQMEDLTRERDILNKNLIKTTNSAQRQMDLIKNCETMRGNLEQNLQGYKIEAQKQIKTIYHLEKEREKYAAEASEATRKYLAATDLVQRKEEEIAELSKKISEHEAKLKQQQNLYEAVRADRNLYSKNLIEAQLEITEMQKRYNEKDQEIKVIKEEIIHKQQDLLNENKKLERTQKEMGDLQNEVSKLQSTIKLMSDAYVQNEYEINRLSQVINEADRLRQRQKKEYENVINERDILGTQLIRRNDELASLYEKIRIQQSTLNKGETQYRERLEDVRALRREIAQCEREIQAMQEELKELETLKPDIHRLERELMQERLRVKALSDELENPMNVHRWRKLEGSDPGKLEMIQRIQNLQRKLIQKTEEVVKKDAEIQEKEKEYLELKDMVARQPGPEVAEQMQVYEENLKRKNAQMKAMENELFAFRDQVSEHQAEIERLAREYQTIKMRYFQQKKRQIIQQRNTEQIDALYGSITGDPSQTGGQGAFDMQSLGVGF